MPFDPRDVTQTKLRLAAVLALAASPAAAQVPGSELQTSARARSEYLGVTYGDVKLLMAEWQGIHQIADPKRIRRMFTDDGLFSPADGWYVQGLDAVADSMAARASRVSGYHSSMVDFAASGSLAYYLGRMGYQIAGPDGAREVRGTFVMVLFQNGRRWRVRSYVERTAID